MNNYFKAIRNIFNFKGRATRYEYWMFLLFNIVILLLIKELNIILSIKIESYMKLNIDPDIKMLCLFILFLPIYSLTIRRFHDIGKSGWMILIFFTPLFIWTIGLLIPSIDKQLIEFILPLIGWIVGFSFLARESEKESNKYGPYIS